MKKKSATVDAKSHRNIMSGLPGFVPSYREKRSELPDLTVPDDTLTIPEILLRHTRGMTLAQMGVVRNPQFDRRYDQLSEKVVGEVDFDQVDLEKALAGDLYEREEFSKEMAQKVLDLKAKRDKLTAERRALRQKERDLEKAALIAAVAKVQESQAREDLAARSGAREGGSEV